MSTVAGHGQLDYSRILCLMQVPEEVMIGWRMLMTGQRTNASGITPVPASNCFSGQADRSGSVHPNEAGAGCTQLSTSYLSTTMKGMSAANIDQKQIVASKASEALPPMRQSSRWKDEMVVTSLCGCNDYIDGSIPYNSDLQRPKQAKLMTLTAANDTTRNWVDPVWYGYRHLDLC